MLLGKVVLSNEKKKKERKKITPCTQKCKLNIRNFAKIFREFLAKQFSGRT